uniref:DUF1230 domain-containing protein n=1 Tax=Fibrocapsa japonica TaxID=94617 RepID=A0A6U1LWA6_9STRA|mmetsp:Transcript_12441/g.18348  ORF Transcript_12441/g.18348 Transcript_12441/m.18348 type:complete len:304 (+) Transcript_12441:104-1015(+)|eukprot:CAMPEP_0113948552 /NCGR_PEP_ID=MMETSP1339-20121228/70850_1 /TAXON_ID=94617 /ORGANISM="Fibrocapsa japonica" /LENGTH=303 /DNA_ID=CAMNT_0000955647 /DNA_START=39 /DNA_END=950 /DNA_ORIENTATION=+ /assembly_acc=CAM_ASM_000762
MNSLLASHGICFLSAGIRELPISTVRSVLRPNTNTFRPTSAHGSTILSVRFAKIQKPPLPRDDDGDEDDDFFGAPGLQDPDAKPMYRMGDKTNTVPLDQQPFNELTNLKKAPFFGWAQKDLKFLLGRLGMVYALFFITLSYPISYATYPYGDQLLERLAAANLGNIIVVAVLVLRLYVGWAYIYDKLGSEVVEYEETGWYDGAQWVKPANVKTRDQFIATYEVKPVVERMEKIVGVFGVLVLLSVLAFKLLSVGDYDPYDPKILQTLQMDENAAIKDAAQNRGKPTYCGSRYYKTVAGGNNCE